MTDMEDIMYTCTMLTLRVDSIFAHQVRKICVTSGGFIVGEGVEWLGSAPLPEPELIKNSFDINNVFIFEKSKTSVYLIIYF